MPDAALSPHVSWIFNYDNSSVLWALSCLVYAGGNGDHRGSKQQSRDSNSGLSDLKECAHTHSLVLSVLTCDKRHYGKELRLTFT